MRPWDRLKFLSPAWRRREEQDMREELEALADIAGRRELGNVTLAMENARATWNWAWMDTVAADIRYSIRTLLKQPAFTGLAVVSLALAIGANSAMFSFADALLLRPLPVSKPGTLFDLSSTTPDNPFEGISFPDFQDLRDKSRSFNGMIAYRLMPVAAATQPKAPAQIRLAMLVGDDFFQTIGVAPSPGRAFSEGETTRPGQPVALISYDCWQQQYSGDASAIGSTVRLNGVAYTIIGVTPESFTGLDRFVRPTLFVPLATEQRLAGDMTDPLTDRGRHDLVVKGRLAPGVSQREAQAELAVIGSALEREYPKTNRNRRPAIRTELQRRIQQTPQMLGLSKMLMGLVGLILVIACSNVANLLLARARSRSREVAIRLSIGAGRVRLVRQFMTESAILGIAGGVAGLFVAYGGVALLGTLNVPSEPPSVLGVQMDWRVVAFSFLAALASCVLFGLAPALHAVRMDFVAAMKGGGHGTSGAPSTRGRDVLVTAQVALAMVVLVAAGLFLDGFRRMLVNRPDFRTDHLISMDTAPQMLHYTPERIRDFYRRLVDSTREAPGAVDVAMAESLPLSPSQSAITLVPEGYQFPKGREKAVVFGGAVDAGYFRVMNVDITAGRAFTEDDRAASRRVAIVNQQFAKEYWPNQNPIGKRVRLDSAQGPELEVVGVAKTGHYLLVNEKPSPYVYVPYDQNPRPRMTLIVRSEGDPAALAGPLRSVVRTIDPDLAPFNVRTVATLYESRATGTWLQFFEMVGAMGLIGLSLAITGLYALTNYMVSRRVKEFGIRIAIGAAARDVVWLVERRGLLLAGIGVLIGGGLAVAATPVLAAAFPGLGASPLAVYALAPLALIAVCALATYVPARRAARLDPLVTLRNE